MIKNTVRCSVPLAVPILPGSWIASFVITITQTYSFLVYLLYITSLVYVYYKPLPRFTCLPHTAEQPEFLSYLRLLIAFRPRHHGFVTMFWRTQSISTAQTSEYGGRKQFRQRNAVVRRSIALSFHLFAIPCIVM